jgi:hypothetical protein
MGAELAGQPATSAAVVRRDAMEAEAPGGQQAVGEEPQAVKERVVEPPGAMEVKARAGQ